MDSQHPLDTLVERLYMPNIRRTGYQMFQVDSYIQVDEPDPHILQFQHNYLSHRLYGTLDSIDRTLHHLGNLRCIDRLQSRKKATDYLGFQPDTCNWLYDFGPNIQHRDHIEPLQVYKDSSNFHYGTSYRTDSHGRSYIPACNIALEDLHPIQ